jgi:protein-arginine kinase activator protein McsA
MGSDIILKKMEPMMAGARKRKHRARINKRITRTRAIEIIVLADLRSGVDVSYMVERIEYLIEKERYEECAGIRRAIKKFEDELAVQ